VRPDLTITGLAKALPYSWIVQVFAKIKHSMRRAMERTVEAALDRLVSVLDTIPPNECANYFSEAGYAPT
jgi:putative transposase